MGNGNVIIPKVPSAADERSLSWLLKKQEGKKECKMSKNKSQEMRVQSSEVQSSKVQSSKVQSFEGEAKR